VSLSFSESKSVPRNAVRDRRSVLDNFLGGNIKFHVVISFYSSTIDPGEKGKGKAETV